MQVWTVGERLGQVVDRKQSVRSKHVLKWARKEVQAAWLCAGQLWRSTSGSPGLVPKPPEKPGRTFAPPQTTPTPNHRPTPPQLLEPCVHAGMCTCPSVLLMSLADRRVSSLGTRAPVSRSKHGCPHFHPGPCWTHTRARWLHTLVVENCTILQPDVFEVCMLTYF